MARLQVYVPDDVARVLAGQARGLLLGRQQYIRAILAAVAQQDETATGAACRRPEAGRSEPSKRGRSAEATR